MLIQQLDIDIKSVAPIHGVSIGDKTNKLTWRIDFKEEATQQEKDAAQLFIDNLDLVEVVKKEKIKEIKEKANADIIAKYPEWKQRNLIAASLDDLVNQLGALFTVDKTKATEAINAWAEIKAIRVKSNQDEAAL